MDIGSLNGHSVGIIMKECVRRAIIAVRAERIAFEVTAKRGYDDTMDDVFTSADKRAQTIVIKSLRECFPSVHIVAEEAPMNAPVPDSVDTFFVVDPLDGTKAFVRKQSHGIGVMVALVYQRKIVSAFIGDINTHEIFGYRPGGGKVHRITDYESAEELMYVPRPLFEGYVLLRDPEPEYSMLSQELIPKFKSHLIDGGSIGIWMARLWKREVSAVILPRGKETPWDSNPVNGISRALGYMYYKPQLRDDRSGILARARNRWELFEPSIVRKVEDRDHDTLIIHRNDVMSFLAATEPEK